MEHSEKKFRKYIIETFSPSTSASATCIQLTEPYEKKKIKGIFQKNNCCLDSENPT